MSVSNNNLNEPDFYGYSRRFIWERVFFFFVR